MEVLINTVGFSRNAKKDIERLPRHIVDKLIIWVDSIEEKGIDEVRKIKSYHDELLKGDRRGYRSIRLNRSYRAIYSLRLEIIVVEEVNKHEY